MSNNDRYDADYFLRGQELGISGYTNYRWLPELTVPMVESMVRHLGIIPSDMILDFGCARGYVVRAFRELGYAAYGYDVSCWAMDNADPAVFYYLTKVFTIAFPPDLMPTYDWVIAKDVLEHIPDVGPVIHLLMQAARTGVFVVVPLSHDGIQYDVPEYEGDVTHFHRRPLQWWVGQFHRPGWSVTGQYSMCGIKDNYNHHLTGNGFITARRIWGSA